MASFLGQITSHDQTLRVGIIKAADSPHSVMFMEGDVSNKGTHDGSLQGRMVFFDVVQTNNGPTAVNISLARKRFFRPGDWLVVCLAPLTLLAATYVLQIELRCSLLLSYIISVNLLCFIIIALLGRSPLTFKTRPAELLLFLLSMAGGAASSLLASYLIPSKMRSDTGRFAMFALIVIHLITLYRLDPKIFSPESIRTILRTR